MKSAILSRYCHINLYFTVAVKWVFQDIDLCYYGAIAYPMMRIEW